MDVNQALNAYRSFDPAGWVAVYQLLPLWGGLLWVAAGLGIGLFGGGRAFRLVAAPLGALVGYLWAIPVAERLGFAPGPYLGQVAMIGLALLGSALPPSIIFLGFGVPAGLIAGALAGPQDFLLGFLPAFLVCGALATSVHRHISSVVTALVGGWLLALGLLTTLSSLGAWVDSIAQRPMLVLGAAGVFGIAGAVYQVWLRPSPAQREAIRSEKERIRQRERDKKALEKRWAHYSANKEKNRA